MRGFSFALVRTMESIVLSFLLSLYAILRKSQALHRKFTSTLLLAFPVSFGRIICYNGFAALPAHFMGGEVRKMPSITTFMLSVAANVASYYICKWLDGWFTGRKH